MTEVNTIMVSIKNPNVFADRIEYTLGYSRGISAAAILFLVIFYVLTFIVAFSLFKPFGKWWYVFIPAACVLCLHIFLFYLRTTGDQLTVILQKPNGIDMASHYEVIQQRKVVVSGEFTQAHLRVESFETYTGLYYRTPTVNYRVVLLPDNDEDSIVLYRNVEEAKCHQQASAISNYLGSPIKGPENIIINE